MGNSCKSLSWWTFRIFFSSCSGAGERGRRPRRRPRGAGLIKKQREGGGGVPRGAGGGRVLGECLWGGGG